MNRTLTSLVIGVSIAAVLAGGFFFLFQKHLFGTFSSNTQGTAAVATTTGNGVSVVGPDGTVIQDIGNTVTYPSLTKPIVITASIPAAQAAVIRTQIQNTIATLTTNPARLDLWLNLGVLRLIAEDYDGA